MSLFKASVLALFALAAAPFAGCGGGPDPNAGFCTNDCQSYFACTVPKVCVFVDPDAALAECVGRCEAGLAALTATESAIFTACVSCREKAALAAGQCVFDLPPDTCASECGAGVDTAGERWAAAAADVLLTSASACTNGRLLLAGETCTAGTGDPSVCSMSCCNGAGCTTAEVGAECDAPDFTTCTCTAGKNKGKTFHPDLACSSDLWTPCNL